MERFVYKQLVHWKCAKGRKPLVLNGARQVGKTWLLKELAQREYAKMAYVMCRKSPVVKEIFSMDFNIERILRALRALTGVDITPGITCRTLFHATLQRAGIDDQYSSLCGIDLKPINSFDGDV